MASGISKQTENAEAIGGKSPIKTLLPAFTLRIRLPDHYWSHYSRPRRVFNSKTRRPLTPRPQLQSAFSKEVKSPYPTSDLNPSNRIPNKRTNSNTKQTKELKSIPNRHKPPRLKVYAQSKTNKKEKYRISNLKRKKTKIESSNRTIKKKSIQNSKKLFAAPTRRQKIDTW